MKAFLLPFLLFSLAANALPRTFTIKDLGARNLFMMQLEGQLEKNIALSRFITGVFSFDPDKNNELSGNWEVDLRSLDTQNELRNLEFREQVLKIQDNPVLRVQLGSVSVGALVDEKTSTLTTSLTNQYGGRSVSQKAQMKLTYFKESKKSQQRLPGNLLRIQITQEWNLENYGLTIGDNFKWIFPSTFTTHTDLVASDALPTDKPIFPQAPKPR